MGNLPFCYVAERDGKWVGVVAPDTDALVKAFYKKFAGEKIFPLHTREEWEAYTKNVPIWRRT